MPASGRKFLTPLAAEPRVGSIAGPNSYCGKQVLSEQDKSIVHKLLKDDMLKSRNEYGFDVVKKVIELMSRGKLEWQPDLSAQEER